MRREVATLKNEPVPDFRNTRGRFRSIDMLRGLAALAVLLGHIKHHDPSGRITLRLLLVLPLDFGSTGVALFVVLSGFCIHFVAPRQMAGTDEFCADRGTCWGRRFHRLHPPYLAAMGLGLLANNFCDLDEIHRDQFDVSPFRDVVTPFLLVANLFKDYGNGLADGPLW